MPKITITIEDKTKEDGSPSVSFTSTFDACGYPDDGPPTPATLVAYTFRAMSEYGVIDRLVPLFRAHLAIENLVADNRFIRSGDAPSSASSGPEDADFIRMLDTLDDLGVLVALLPFARDFYDFSSLVQAQDRSSTDTEGG